jgi:hypothetical protein
VRATSRIGLNSPETDHVGPAGEARHYRYDVVFTVDVMRQVVEAIDERLANLAR